MGIGRSCGLFCVVFWIAISPIGCSSSGGGRSADSSGYETYTTSGSDLVLQIPDTLYVSQDDIEDIHYYADQVAHCYVTNREAIDIVLAEACIYYDMLYLYPEYFPENLDGILNVGAYVRYLNFFDPFTFYFTPEDFVEVMSLLTGNSAFIGISIECSGQTVTEETPLIISGIEPHSRAWIDGFEVGDSIINIGGTTLNGLSLDTVNTLFPGTEEEPVQITVERDGVEITFFTAAEENIGLLLYGDMAYLSVRSFTEDTGENVMSDFEKLKEEAEGTGGTIDKIILDLRGNGGGEYSGTLMLIDYLINTDDGSPIVTKYGPYFGETTEYLGDHNEYNIGDFDKTNFVLLVDGYSASASEITAAALKYYETAYLIGETTFGKGIGQSVVELIDGTGVFIPSLESLPPSGESYHGIGIDPDYPLNAWPTSFDDDPVLDAAVEYLNSGIITGTTASTSAVENKRISDDVLPMDPFREDLLKKDRSGSFF